MQRLFLVARGVHVRSRFFAVVILSLSLLASQIGLAEPMETSSSTPPQLVVKTPLANGHDLVITATEFAEGSPEQIKQILNAPETQNSDVLVSTDQETVLEAVAEATIKPQDKRLLRFIPIGKLASASQKIASGFKTYYQNAKKTLSGDRIGLAVVTISFGVDTYIWIHAASFDIHQKTSMILMNLVMASTFGLDRDLWSKMTAPTKNRLIKTFDKFITNDKLVSIKILSSQFAANMLFGFGVQTIRTGLLSLDHLSAAVVTSDFWFTAGKIAGLASLTGFAWTELSAAINEEKFPVAKYMMKRLGDMRGIIMCQLATISMVMQPHIYGSTPIYSYILHGTIGLVALANTQTIIKFLESNAVVNKIYKKIQTFEDFINTNIGLRQKKSTLRMCKSLFAT
jgi:hypothetical protein